jgi:hypothetical protein
MPMTEIIRTKTYYAPYHLYPAFDKGFLDYCKGNIHLCPYSLNSVDGQAWDRGAEYASYLRNLLLRFENKVFDLHEWLYGNHAPMTAEEIIKDISYLQGHLQYMSDWMKQQQMS